MAEVRIAPDELTFQKTGEYYVLQYKGQDILTPGDNLIKAKNKDFLEYLVSEYRNVGYDSITIVNNVIRKPLFLGAYTILSTQLDFIETGLLKKSEFRIWVGDDKCLEFMCNLENDATELSVKTLKSLNALGITEIPNDRSGMLFNKYLNIIMDIWSNLNPWQKSVVVNLYSLHNRVVFYPILIVSGLLNEKEYAISVASIDMMTGLLPGFSIDEWSSRVKELEDDAQVCVDYLGFW